MNLKTQRRMASRVLKSGKDRVWIDPDRIESVAEAVTREDIRKLIDSGAITAKQKRGISKARTRKRKLQVQKGRRSGQGKRKGSKGARFSAKERWMSTIRPLRKMLKELRDSEKLQRSDYRKLYRLAKSGTFKSKSHLETYLKEHKLLR